MIFFKNLKRFKFKKENPIEPIHTPKSSDEAFHYQVLKSLKDERIALTVQFSNHAQDYISMILEINFKNKFIIIDEMNERTGHQLALNRVPFVVSSQYQGISLCFAATVLGSGTQDGVHYYRLAFPEKMDYLQRRLAPRVLPPVHLPFYVDLKVPGFGAVQGKIEDISIAGLQFSLPRNMKQAFYQLDRINNLRINSPYLPSKVFSLTVKHFRFDNKLQRTLVGGQFSSLDNADLKYLSSIVLRLI